MSVPLLTRRCDRANDAHVQDPGGPTLDHLDVSTPLVSRGSPSRDQDGLDARHAVERRGQGVADPVVHVYIYLGNYLVLQYVHVYVHVYHGRATLSTGVRGLE